MLTKTSVRIKVRTYIPNRYSKKGVMDMNWLQKNSYIVVLFTTFMMMAGILFITDNGDTTYEQYEIQHGDTLWTLAEQFRGKMTIEEWINSVKAENGLNNEIIVAGHQITIPINENSNFIAKKIENEDIHSVEVAIKNNEHK